ncbi:S-methyl-5-thioribose-1-phosphate isomerase [Candidatus Fermentibacterales bacterium]|nr:S-methyl-5-thioribose-1-phosphate isomerase [Candidatus Fermentibacterales bacterium]
MPDPAEGSAPGCSPVPPVPTLVWRGDCLELLDQTLLPETEATVRCESAGDVARAISGMIVRGAPAIGLAAAYGVVLSAMGVEGGPGFRERVERDISLLSSTRPTAANLFHCLELQREIVSRSAGRDEAVERLLQSADELFRKDVEASLAMGRLGADLLGPGVRLLTHCNAGGLATSGFGTALAVFYEARARGWLAAAWADETRPLLQGARLTAWELTRAGIPVTVLPDSAAASLLRSGAVDAVFVGADRVAGNGDFANKIGTYPLALASREAGVPFHVVAPLSSFDTAAPDGGAIPIEERDGGEVRCLGGRILVPSEANVYNPAFDVTPGSLATAIVCEEGVLRPPYEASIGELTGCRR